MSALAILTNRIIPAFSRLEARGQRPRGLLVTDSMARELAASGYTDWLLGVPIKRDPDHNAVWAYEREPRRYEGVVPKVFEAF